MSKDLLHSTDPKTLSLAELLIDRPRARATLQHSIERQKEQADAAGTRRPVIHANCPHCNAEGVVYLTLPTGEFRRRRADCCQPAIRDAALAALHAGMNPNSNDVSAREELKRYAVLRSAIKQPALLRELDTHQLLLDSLENRILPVKRGIENKPSIN
jgi:hypothetical protein